MSKHNAKLCYAGEHYFTDCGVRVDHWDKYGMEHCRSLCLYECDYCGVVAICDDGGRLVVGDLQSVDDAKDYVLARSVMES
jgi:hypothetical protein